MNAGRPPYYLQAKNLRREKGLSQEDVARRLGVSQAYVSRLENAGCATDDAREYLERIKSMNANRRRTAGGAEKVGRTRSQRGSALAPPSAYRGADLAEDYGSLLPASWEMLAKCRASDGDELALLWDEGSARWGLTTFHLIDGVVRRGRIVPFDRDDMVSLALEAWAHGFLGDGGAASSRDPDAVLGDDDE